MPSPPPRRIRTSKITGNSAVAGTEAAIWASGFASDFDVAFFQCRKTKHGGGFDDRQEVVDIHRQRLGETVNIVATALVVEKLEQSGDAAGTGVR
jgi:hypothetical protein